MLDLGTSFIASVARDPDAIAIVDADQRLTYAQWYKRISSVVAAFDDLGLRPGDHVVTVLQNRYEAATIHWACQFAGIVITPINWRAKSDELDFCIQNSESKAIVYEDGIGRRREQFGSGAGHSANLHYGDRAVRGPVFSFGDIIRAAAPEVEPRVGADAWSLMLYTSGTTSKPKGVPRRHRAERAAGVAHVAQNLYGRGRVYPGRDAAVSHHGGAIADRDVSDRRHVCMPSTLRCRSGTCRSSRPRRSPTCIWSRRSITIWFIIPTFKRPISRSVRKLGFAGASMTDGLLEEAEFDVQT